MYIWEDSAWPTFGWNSGTVSEPLALSRFKQGRLIGGMARLDERLRREAQLEILTEDIVKSAGIDSVTLDPGAVRAALAARLGVDSEAAGDTVHATASAERAVAVTLAAAESFAEPLTAEMLIAWHGALDDHHAGAPVGWRDDARGPARIVSVQGSTERIHFEAPPAARIPDEIAGFLDWFNGRSRTDGVVRAAVAHLWFSTILPFAEDNGRIARLIADKALAQAEGSGLRVYSLSRQLRKERIAYFATREAAQRGKLDVTEWVGWFVDCFGRAVDGAEEALAAVLFKADFWRAHGRESLSERQIAVLDRLLDRGRAKVTAIAWARLGKCSIATAQRDINDLLARKMLTRNPGGSKNTSYTLGA